MELEHFYVIAGAIIIGFGWYKCDERQQNILGLFWGFYLLSKSYYIQQNKELINQIKDTCKQTEVSKHETK